MAGKIKNKHQEEKSKHLAVQNKSEPSPESLPPIFSLRYLNKEYCLSKCEKDEKAAFADTLHRLSNLTWAQIKAAPRQGLGYEIIPRKGIPGIPAHVTDEVNLIAFRFCAKAPMVGYRDRTTFHIIWLDRDFTLYDHG